MCPKTPQWWQTWGLTKDLELDKSVIDFIPVSPFSNWGTKTIFDLEAVEEEGSEEIAYLKPVLSELGFWALKTSSSFVPGAKKFSFWQMRFMLGWGPKPKLDDGLEARLKGYRWSFWRICLILYLGSKMGLTRVMRWPKNTSYNRDISTIKSILQ